jgi:uncharacterized membrane protein
VAFIDRLTRRFSRLCLFLFWICALLALAWCTAIGVGTCSGR